MGNRLWIQVGVDLRKGKLSLTFFIHNSCHFFGGHSLQEGGFNAPRRGKNNDKAHPPIHPTAHAGNLAGDEKKVYEFITRRFLAGCSKDAEGFETTVDVDYGEEQFCATGRLCCPEDNKRGLELYFPR